MVRMENSCEKVPVMQEGRLVSQKPDGALHGKGMGQIQRVTAQYGGHFSWQYDGAQHACDTHEILDAEGWVAEQRQDWKTAQRCYGDQVNRFGAEDEDLKKACINKLNRVTKKLNESEKGKPVDMDDAMNGESLIDLDE